MADDPISLFPFLRLSRPELADVTVALEEYLGMLYDYAELNAARAASIKNLEAVLARIATL